MEVAKEINPTRIGKHVARFLEQRGIEVDPQVWVESYLLENPDSSKQDVFNAAATGWGVPKSYCSADADTDEMMPISARSRRSVRPKW